MSDADDGNDEKRQRMGRSPAYPFISLEKALDQTRALYKKENRYFAPLPSLFKAWGFGEKSSSGRQTLAALRYFGLIDVEGEGDARKARVSDVAFRILTDEREDQTERQSLIRRLALNPTIHAQIMEKWPNGLQSDGSVKYHLINECGYNELAAGELLSEFKETAAFASLFEPVNVQDKGAEGKAAGSMQENPGTETKKIVPEMDPFGLLKTDEEGWETERLIDDDGEQILLNYRGKPSVERYEYIRDYLDFKIKRMRASKKD